MKQWLEQHHKEFEWSLGIVVIIVSIAAWLSSRDITSELTIYDIFPPLGLLAFGLMWTHFVMAALRRYLKIDSRGQSYKTASFGIVLALLILHPGLLWLGLYEDGYGLPPGSHIEAYKSQLFAVGLGTVGLIIFLSFELRRWFGHKRWWRVIDVAQILGMVAIFYHAIELGDELRQGWFMAVWWFYGITLAAAIIYSETMKIRNGGSHVKKK